MPTRSIVRRCKALPYKHHIYSRPLRVYGKIEKLGKLMLFYKLREPHHLVPLIRRRKRDGEYPVLIPRFVVVVLVHRPSG